MEGTWFQHLLCHSRTLMIDTLCPISTLNHRLTNLEQIHIRCSLHCERWTVKGRDCTSVLHFFNKVPTRWTSERNSCYGWRVEWSLKTRSNGWNSGVFDELEMYLSVAIAYCFSCLTYTVCWSIICRNFCCKLTFFPFPWRIWVRGKSSSTFL